MRSKTPTKILCKCGCGLRFTRDGTTRRYAPECKTKPYQRPQTLKYQKKYKRKVTRNPARSNRNWVSCKCPMCLEYHKVNIYWTGTTKPRIYCPTCKGLVEKREYEPCRTRWSDCGGTV